VEVTVLVRRGLTRFTTREKGRQTRHSFSFGEFYDPERVSFGPLVALNDDLLGTGAGYDAHPHRDVVLVTWVVRGELTHVDESGAVVQPAGELAVTDAGTGLTHSERAIGGATRFVQMWLRPGETGTAPTRRTTAPDLASGDLTPVAGPGGLPLNVPGATLWLAEVGAGRTLAVPAFPLVYLFVVTGALTRSSLAEPLAAGDAFEFRDEQGLSVTAAVPTQLLVWTFEA
jgi:redox-sensitive bicupin YhaK (pirin superfamily)